MTRDKTTAMLVLIARLMNQIASLIVFSFLDVVDASLCLVFKLVDFFIEAEWKPCYCSSSKEAITSSGSILVSEDGTSKILCLGSTNKLHLEDISDTLYTRPSIFSQISKLNKVVDGGGAMITSREKLTNNGTTVTSTFTINSTVIEMLQGKIGGPSSHPPIPRWSDCDCSTCTCWTSSSSKHSLFVKAQGPKDKVKEDVLFIHGFISSSAFWTETVFPNFSEATKSSHRLIAIDLLGFGRSPKPVDSLYTLREHIDMIERVIEQYKVKSFHIVAHSLGCILALAIAQKHQGAIKSLTLLAPPYFPVPKGEQATQYVMRRVGPRRIWPIITFGASLALWYEHITRTACLLVCKNHRLWNFLAKLVTRNRMRTFLVDGFFCHTHNAAWHTLHNIICGTAGKVDGYLEVVCNQMKCDVSVFHGRDDDLLPVDCSYAIQSRVPRAHVKIIDNKDHITIVVGRQKSFARELEHIWNKSTRFC